MPMLQLHGLAVSEHDTAKQSEGHCAHSHACPHPRTTDDCLDVRHMTTRPGTFRHYGRQTGQEIRQKGRACTDKNITCRRMLATTWSYCSLFMKPVRGENALHPQATQASVDCKPCTRNIEIIQVILGLHQSFIPAHAHAAATI